MGVDFTARAFYGFAVPDKMPQDLPGIEQADWDEDPIREVLERNGFDGDLRVIFSGNAIAGKTKSWVTAGVVGARVQYGDHAGFDETKVDAEQQHALEAMRAILKCPEHVIGWFVAGYVW